MHEMPYVKAALAKVLEEAKGRKVERVNIEVGPGVSDATEFRGLFFMLSESTVAANAKLELVMLKPTLKCHSCGYDSTLEYSPVRCPKCGCRQSMDAGALGVTPWRTLARSDDRSPAGVADNVALRTLKTQEELERWNSHKPMSLPQKLAQR